MRLGRLSFLLTCLIAASAFADDPPGADSLSDRIAEIEHVHIHQPWPVSQRMIDALEPELVDASTLRFRYMLAVDGSVSDEFTLHARADTRWQ